MSTYDESLHPRGQAQNAGQFRAKTNDAPGAALTLTDEDAVEASADAIDLNAIIATFDHPERYASADVEWNTITDRTYQQVDGPPSRRVDQDRPSFTGTGEQDFRTALSRIDAIWDADATIEQRSEALIADMRRSGSLGAGGGAALEAYARALSLNESGGYLDEENVNYLLDQIEAGNHDYRTHARAFGYHPEQYAIDLATAARAAAFHAEHAEDERTRAAAKERHATMLMLAKDAASRLDRGWSSRENDIDRLGDLIGRSAGSDEDGLTRLARTRAYADALDLIFSCGHRD